MPHFFPRIFTLFFFITLSTFSAWAQDTTRPGSVDPALIELENSRIPKEYTISSVKVVGANFLDTSIVISISGLQAGDKIQLPGGDAFSKAITNLWRQRLFSNVQIFITALRADDIDIEINVLERPKLGDFKFIGIKKSEAEELQGKIGLTKSTIITENTRRNAVEGIDFLKASTILMLASASIHKHRSLIVGKYNPDRGMITCFFPSTYIVIHACSKESLVYKWAKQEMINT